MNFLVSHIYRKGNECVDALENMGLSLVIFFFFWNDIPQPVYDSLARNKKGMP
jgi:hypothetical protein